MQKHVLQNMDELISCLLMNYVCFYLQVHEIKTFKIFHFNVYNNIWNVEYGKRVLL